LEIRYTSTPVSSKCSCLRFFYCRSLLLKTDVMNTGKYNKNSVRVAIIDDNAQLRDMSVKQLEKSGYTVLFQTGDGQDALQKLKEHNGWPDVCIIEEDFATAKLLLEEHPDLKILISSTEDDTESVTDMLKAGVSG